MVGGHEADQMTALLEAGADPSVRAEGGHTPLHLAAILGDAGAMTALLQAGADPSARTEGGLFPFDYIRDKEQLKATDVYWELNQARF